MDTIKKIDIYYKRQKKNLQKMNMTQNYIIKFDKKRGNIVNFYNGQNKVYAAEYIFYGVISNDLTFSWSNTIYGFNNKKMIKNINDIKAKKEEFKKINTERSKFYFNLLSNDKIKLKNNEESNWLFKLLIYLNKDFYYINPLNSNNYMQVIGINKIKERYT